MYLWISRFVVVGEDCRDIRTCFYIHMTLISICLLIQQAGGYGRGGPNGPQQQLTPLQQQQQQQQQMLRNQMLQRQIQLQQRQKGK